jgi:biopolymer transport protein ExbD
MIDVVLQLVIFFLFTTRMGEIVRSAADLPRQPGEQDRLEPTDLVLTVARDGRLSLGGVEVTIAGLPDRLRALAAETGRAPLELRADRTLPAAAIDPVLRAVSTAEFREVRFATFADAPGGPP